MKRNLHARNKEELIAVAQMIRNQMGKVAEINYLENEEEKQEEAFWPVSLCYLLCDNLPLPDGGVQRKADVKKVRNICNEALSAAPPSFRTNILLNIRPEEFNANVRKATGKDAFIRLDDKKHCYLFFLDVIIEYLKQLPTDEEGNLLNIGTALLGTIVDGQNRVSGLMEAGATDSRYYFKRFAANVKCDQTRQQTAKDAYDTNEPQRQPSRDAALAMGFAAQALSPEEAHAYILATELSKNGPLKGIFAPYEKGQKKPVSMAAMCALVMKWLRDEEKCSRQNEKSMSEQVNSINDYLAAWAECYPEAWWTGRQNHILCKAQGLNIIFGVYPQMYEYLAVKNGVRARFSKWDYENAVKDCFFHYDGHSEYRMILMNELSDQYGSVPFDWSSGPLKEKSSGSGINTMKALLRARICRVEAMLLPDSDDLVDEDEDEESGY